MFNPSLRFARFSNNRTLAAPILRRKYLRAVGAKRSMHFRQSAPVETRVKKAGKLLAKSSPAIRTQTTAAVAAEFAHGGMTEQERRVAIGILEIMARDVEQQVRELCRNR